jgi:hypothetical protein
VSSRVILRRPRQIQCVRRCPHAVREVIAARTLRTMTQSNIHPNSKGVDRHRLAQRQAEPQSDCLWRSCTAHKRCHISLAASHRRRAHSHFRPRCLRLNQYQRQLPRLFPYVPPLIQLQRLPERLVRCQRQRYPLRRHSPPGRGIGTLSLAERRPGSTDRLPGKTHKTCSGRAWLRTMGWLGRYKRIPHRRNKDPLTRRDKEIL